MPIPVDVSIMATVNGVAIVNQSLPLDVAAVDDISIEVPGATTDLPVAVQPGPATALVYLVIATPPGSPEITYKPNLGGQSIPLRNAHVYSGPGMAALLGATPTTLYVSNPDANPVAVRILAMRQN